MPFRPFPILSPVLLAGFALVACDKDDVTSAGGIGNARIAPRAEAISAYPALQPADASTRRANS